MKKKILNGIQIVLVLALLFACDNKTDIDDENGDLPEDTIHLNPPIVSEDESVVSLVQSTTVTKATNFTYEEILKMTREAIRLAGGLTGIVKAGDTVVLKPNVVSAYYNWGGPGSDSVPKEVNGMATDWRVIQAVAVIVREIIGASGRILLIEGPAGNPSSSYFNTVGWTSANLTAVDEIIGLDTEGTWVDAGVGTNADELITLPDFHYKQADDAKLSWGGGYAYNDYYKNDGKYWVNKKMLEADALICIPVVKTHNAAGGVTGSIKNIGIGAAPPNVYGMGPDRAGRNAMINHNAMVIHDWISDYYRCLPADFVVMDGLQGLQNGPGGQANEAALKADQKNLRCILASKDALAIDTVEAFIMNWDVPKYMKNIAVIKEVFARGEIGKQNPRKIPQRGDTKDIVVIGNRKVDDIRGNINSTTNDTRTEVWSGSLSNGGVKLTAANLTKPTVSINSASFTGESLNLDLTLSTGTNDNVVKIDVYINNQYKASIMSNMTNITLDTSDIAAGEHKIQVFGYTRYLSHGVAEVNAIK